MTYPERRGRTIPGWNGTSFDGREFSRSGRKDPTTLRDLESFLQTWLYFGLLTEIICVNSSGLGDDTCVSDTSTFRGIVDRIYDETLVSDGDKTYVRLSSDCFDAFLESARTRFPEDPETRKRYYNGLISCLFYTNSMLSAVPDGFNHAVKSSIAALGELLASAVYTGFQRLQVSLSSIGSWGWRFFNEEAKTSMRSNGWCISDIARVEAKCVSVQGSYMAQMMDKSLPSRDHSRCSESVCTSYHINTGSYHIRHQQEGCSCSPLEVNSELLTGILRNGDRFPVLRLEGDHH
jgi:hypothetical protein